VTALLVTSECALPPLLLWQSQPAQLAVQHVQQVLQQQAGTQRAPMAQQRQLLPPY
jgi:hypothetical protein